MPEHRLARTRAVYQSERVDEFCCGGRGGGKSARLGLPTPRPATIASDVGSLLGANLFEPSPKEQARGITKLQVYGSPAWPIGGLR